MSLERKRILLGALFISTVSAFIFFATPSPEEEGNNTTSPTSHSQKQNPAEQEAATATSTGARNPTHPARHFELKASDFLSDSFNRANSIEEAQWLLRNGYPTYLIRESTKGYLPQDTELNSSTLRDSAAIIGAGNRLIRDRSDPEAARFLHEAAAGGSAYATEQLAGATIINGGNPILATAYYKTAAAQGNWALEANGLTRLADLRSDLIASLTAQRMQQDFYKARQNNGITGAGYDPRPGLAAFAEEAESTTPNDKP